MEVSRHVITGRYRRAPRVVDLHDIISTRRHTLFSATGMHDYFGTGRSDHALRYTPNLCQCLPASDGIHPLYLLLSGTTGMRSRSSESTSGISSAPTRRVTPEKFHSVTRLVATCVFRITFGLGSGACFSRHVHCRSQGRCCLLRTRRLAGWVDRLLLRPCWSLVPREQIQCFGYSCRTNGEA